MELRLACFRSSSAGVRLLAVAIPGLVAGSAGLDPIAAASVAVKIGLVESVELARVRPTAAKTVMVKFGLVESARLARGTPIAAASVRVELVLVESAGLVAFITKVGIIGAVHSH